MRRAKLTTFVVSGAISGLVAAFVTTSSIDTASMALAAGQPGSSDLSIYKDLYYARIAADIGKNTAILKRIEQGDVKTVQAIVRSFLKGDLLTVEMNTNYSWGAEQKVAIASGQEYQKTLGVAQASK